MADALIGQIMPAAFGYAPRDWALCEGQLLSAAQHPSLYSLIGTSFGGDGTTFALPDLRGRTPIHVDYSQPGTGDVGSKGGEEFHTLQLKELAAHRHPIVASGAGAQTPLPANNLLAAVPNLYGDPKDLVVMRAGTLTEAGGGVAHYNMQPYVVLNFCICLAGINPSRGDI